MVKKHLFENERRRHRPEFLNTSTAILISWLALLTDWAEKVSRHGRRDRPEGMSDAHRDAVAER
jgi:hypothetical protein